MKWIEASKDKIAWVEKFKEIFINQQENRLSEIFNNSTFGIHNSLSMLEYCKVEMEEFKLKCEKFGLNMGVSIRAYDLPEEMFYFALGKKDDLAVFEGIFKWNSELELADGNGYKYKIEPKIQFVNDNKCGVSYKRRVNIKPRNGNEILKVIEKQMPESSELIKVELNDILGGNFYGYIREEQENNLKSDFQSIKIYDKTGSNKQSILMRGNDHPLFIDKLWPELSNDKTSFKIKEYCWPVIIWVLLTNGEEHFYKYPKEKFWSYSCEIKEVCLTDNLSFDWIVKNG